jgi:hypothetical protein
MIRSWDVIASGSGGMAVPTTSEQPTDIIKEYTWYIPGIYQDKIDIPGIYQIYARFVLYRSRYDL